MAAALRAAPAAGDAAKNFLRVTSGFIITPLRQPTIAVLLRSRCSASATEGAPLLITFPPVAQVKPARPNLWGRSLPAGISVYDERSDENRVPDITLRRWIIRRISEGRSRQGGHHSHRSDLDVGLCRPDASFRRRAQPPVGQSSRAGKFTGRTDRDRHYRRGGNSANRRGWS